MSNNRFLQDLEVAGTLAKRVILSDFHASRMSLAWPLVYPGIYTLLVLFLKPVLGGGARNISIMQFGAFVFIGMGLWQVWLEAMKRQMEAVRSNKVMVARGELGARALYLTTVLVIAFQSTLKLLVCALLAIFLLHSSAIAIALMLAGFLLLLLNGAFVGAVLQPFATLSPDVGKAVQSSTMAILISGAVFIRLPDNPSRGLVTMVSCNPVGALLNMARAPLFGEPVLVPVAAMVWIALTLAGTVLMLAAGKRILPILIERMGG